MIDRIFIKAFWLTLAALVFAISGLFPQASGLAQEVAPTRPVYIVQEGDSLWGIAARFGVSVAELQELNGITNADALKVNDQLQIPGLEGLQGVIGTIQAGFGDTVRGLERAYQITPDQFIRLNRLSSPNDLFAGSTVILPELPTGATLPGRATLGSGQTMLELAVLNNTTPWALVERNGLTGASRTVPGDVLSTSAGSGGPSGLPEWLGSVEVEPLSLLQGKASVISIAAPASSTISGTLLDHDMQFFPNSEKGFSALQGVHAMTEPGLYPLSLDVALPDGRSFHFEQMVPVKAVDYPYDQPLAVDPATIDPAVTKPEDAQWSALAAPVTPERLWNGVFKLPSPLEVGYCLDTGDCWSSSYGNRRSYNGSPYLYFHTGLDIVGQTGVEIYAPADGLVVFAGPLTVRGNATMINHGQGVYTGYMHQSEIFVKPGETVKAGQLIGKVGGTGRVQGPHLHWEVWVGGVQVDPIDWLERAYP